MNVKTFFIVVALCLTSGIAHAQLGETEEQLAARYGVASPSGKMLTPDYDSLIEDYRTFHHDGLKVYAGFKAGQAVFLMFQREDKERMEPKQVFAILSRSVAKPDWELLSGRSPNPRWGLAGGSAFAYYYPEPDSDGAPARFVRVQTAAMDAVYTRLREQHRGSRPPHT